MTRNDAATLMPFIVNNVRSNYRKRATTLLGAYANGKDIQKFVDGKWVDDKDPTFADLKNIRVKRGPRPLTMNELRKYNGARLSCRKTGRPTTVMVLNDKVAVVEVSRYMSPAEVLSEFMGPDGLIMGKMPADKS